MVSAFREIMTAKGCLENSSLHKKCSLLAQENPLKNFSLSNVNVATRQALDCSSRHPAQEVHGTENSFTPFEVGLKQWSEANTQALGHELNRVFFSQRVATLFIQQESYNIHHAQIQKLCTQVGGKLTV